MMRLRLRTDIPPRVTVQKLSRPRCLVWYKATPAEKEEYTVRLEERLQQILVPLSLQCRDVHCNCDIHSTDCDTYILDVMSAVIEVSHQTIPISKGWTGDRKSSVPNWKESVSQERSYAMFWHAVWVSSGRQNTGELNEVDTEQIPLCSEESTETGRSH
jgi:hypothetical protein